MPGKTNNKKKKKVVLYFQTRGIYGKYPSVKENMNKIRKYWWFSFRVREVLGSTSGQAQNNFFLSFLHKLWPKFENRWISRLGSLRFWWKSVEHKARMRTIRSREIFTKKCRQQQNFDSDHKEAWHYNHVIFTPIAKNFMLCCRLIRYPCYMLDLGSK